MFLKVKIYRDEELYRILDETSKMFNDANGKLDFKKIGKQHDITDTVWALTILSFRLRWLCESILSCKDYYSAAILYRAFLEHSFKHKYILVSCMKKGNATAKEYLSSEHMSYELLQKLRKVKWPDTLQPTDQLIKQNKRNEFKHFKKRANKTADKFKFGEVAKSMFGLIREYCPNEIQKVLRQAVMDYSTLSSYVHAGPTAVLNLEQQSKKNIDMPSMILTIIAYNDIITLLSSYCSEHQDRLKTLNKGIDEKIEKAVAIYEKNYVS